MRNCLHCHRPIPRQVAFCPYCSRRVGRAFPFHLSRQGLAGGAAAGFLFALFWCMVTGFPALIPVREVPVQQTVEVTRVVLLPVSPAGAIATTELPILPAPAMGANAGLRRVAEVDGMAQRFVPAGSFLMGTAEGEPGTFSGERPQRLVWLSAYLIDETEVTNGQYQQCLAAGHCRRPFACSDSLSILEDSSRANEPVACVDWYEAESYCQWVNRRLPTEAEWEKAARGVEGWLYPWGDALPTCGRANFAGTGCVGQLVEAGRYAAGASPYGALDMAGNVAEWTADYLDYEYYPVASIIDPPGPPHGLLRVLRGGSYNSIAVAIRTAVRNGLSAATSAEYIGFRCAETEGAE
jgi:formylglycine-generating enzyme required for sulfatase activity